MIKRCIKSTLKKLGYDLRRIDSDYEEAPRYALYPYLKRDGSFDYEMYRGIQEAGNKKKIDNVWVIEDNIAFLSQYIRNLIQIPRFGICHGTRRGKEQEWFRKYLNCEVIGTEISATAASFPNTIQWDFHEVKPEWKDSADFIYSNSFDHSYDPEKCLNAWMRCLKKEGLCIIEHCSSNDARHSSRLDPFKADIFIMPYLITTWGNGKYFVREILTAPTKGKYIRYQNYIVVQRL